jgi:hypothetical protein
VHLHLKLLKKSSAVHQIRYALNVVFYFFHFKFVVFHHPECSGPWKSGSRCRLSKAWGLLGKPKGGAGNLEWGGVEEGEVSLRTTWDQGGQDRFMPKEGFQVSKRGIKREVNKEPARGVKGGIAP